MYKLVYKKIPECVLTLKSGYLLMQAYCFKCRTKRKIKTAQSITLKNGKQAIQGTCPVHRNNVFRMGKA